MSLMLGRNPAYYPEFRCAECRGDLSYAERHIFCCSGYGYAEFRYAEFRGAYLRPKKLYSLVPGMQLHN